MPLSRLQTRVLNQLRQHRSSRSWVSGSAVLHHILLRPIGDLDIHHASVEEMLSAAQADLALLLQKGFCLNGTRKMDYEFEAILRINRETLSVNWVFHPVPLLFPLCFDQLMGARVDVRDAVYQKLLMIGDGRDDKHFDDLAACDDSGLLSEQILAAAANAQSTSTPDDYRAWVTRGIHESGNSFRQRMEPSHHPRETLG